MNNQCEKNMTFCIDDCRLDYVLKNGSIIDGTGNPSYYADVGVKDEVIVKIGKISEEHAVEVIDGSGKIICPGFIDAHSHTDSTIYANPTAESTIRQGITTEIVGNCGMSAAPLSIGAKVKGAEGFGSYQGVNIPPCSFTEFIELVGKMGTSINLAWFLGHNTIRNFAGITGSTVPSEQFKIMEKAIYEAMEAGALGLTTGLEFEPGRSATKDEVLKLVKIVGKCDGMYASHIRNRDSHIQNSIEEFIDIIRKCGTKGQVSHLNVRHNTGAPEGAWQKAVNSIEQARSEGMNILTDMTPLQYGIGQMAAILPNWIRRLGTENAAKMLLDSQIRFKLKEDCDRYWRFIYRGEWERVRMQSNPVFPEINGLTFPEISDLWDKDPWDCYFDILAAAGTKMDTVVLVALLFTEEHLREAISNPLFMLVVDGYSTQIDGVLAEQTKYPLHYMGMVHFLTHHVREKKTLKLEEAIRKMTSMPAIHFGFKDRGLIKEGFKADIVVFDFQALQDVSTVEKPLAYVEGVENVFVNGRLVIKNSEHTGARPGRNLLR